jgi:hypothetical protein
MLSPMRHVFLAFTNPVPGSEAVFNSWYDSKHVPEVLRYGRGFLGCRRFKLQPEARHRGLAPWAYLALYDLGDTDLAALAASPWAEPNPPLTSFRGILQSDHVAWVYTPRTPRISRDPSGPAEQRSANHLLLMWSELTAAPNEEGRLRELVSQTVGCVAARAFTRADAQRQGQLDSPWQSLVIYEVQNVDVVPASRGAGAAWSYVAVSDYVFREAT